jgi:SIR2-like domain
MTRILLTGAGFSRNWGGWLAGEVFSYLLSCKLDDETRDLLIKYRATGGFENAMSDLQRRIKEDPTEANKVRLHALTSELYGMFNLMGQSFLRGQFEFQNEVAYMVTPFLNRFDAIFTVNQDTLLESHYFEGTLSRWSGVRLPGMKQFGPPPHTVGSIFDKIRKMTPDISNCRIDANLQPYFKLHGSINWVIDDKSGLLMVLGGDKLRFITDQPILDRYQQEFDAYLARPGARLMVIGYGYNDPHINDAISRGVEHGLKLFIVDPAGMEVLARPIAYHFGSAVLRAVIGVSERPLSATFNRDQIEHGKLTRFFEQ